MYIIVRKGEMSLVKKQAIVTAGFMCAPVKQYEMQMSSKCLYDAEAKKLEKKKNPIINSSH